MLKSSRWAAFLIALAAWLHTPAIQAAPIDDFLNKAPAALKDLVGNNVSNVATPPNEPWSASGSLFGMPTTTIYLYWVQGSNTPVVAVALPDKLTADRLLHVGSELDVGVTSPVLLWVPEGIANLEKAAMPRTVRERAGTLGLPDKVEVLQGFNLFGSMSGGSFLDALLKPVNLQPSKLTGGLAKGKDGVYITSLLVPSAWNKPFGLEDTSITGAMVRVIKDSKSKTVEAWGTVRVKNSKNYTAYMKRDELGVNQSFGFDAKSASLSDFFTLVGVTASTLQLPPIQWPSKLPLDKVTIDNTEFDARRDPRIRPDFTKMMFQAARENGQVGQLNLNVAARVFGWQMGEGHIKADSSGVDGNTALAQNTRIGPINVPSARFYMKVNSSEQNMGIKADTALYGTLDIRASTTALTLNVPASCPLRPVGFSADVTDIGSDFPIKPSFADCFSEELRKLADGAEDAYKETEQFVADVADDTAKTATDLAGNALKEAESLHLERAAAWPGAIVGFASDLQSAKDAARIANEAAGLAQQAVDKLGGTIRDLNKAITGLADDIRDLLKSVWGAVTGDVRKKEKEKEKKVAERDSARTQKAAADARLASAKKLAAEKSDAIYKLPGPYLAGTTAELREPLLAAKAQAVVQPRIAQMAQDLPAQLKAAGKRKEIFGKVAPQTVVSALSSGFESKPPKISDLVKDGQDRGKEWLGDAKKNLVARAVSAHVESQTESMLLEEVANLPTMSNSALVNIVLVNKTEGSSMCIEALGDENIRSQPWYNLKPCSASLNQTFNFERPGFLKVKYPGTSHFTVECIDAADGKDSAFKKKGKYCAILGASTTPSEYRFFYDPIDGLIRYKPPYDNTVLCVRVGDQNRIVGGACPGPNEEVAGTRWRLVKSADYGKSVTAVKSMAASRIQVPGRIPAGQQTNLEPLRLK